MSKAIVIGNGKSLLEHIDKGDFDLFKKVDTFAMNKIHGLYYKNIIHNILGTSWRPTYWFWVEHLDGDNPTNKLIDELYENHIEPDLEICYIDIKFYDYLVDRHSDVKYKNIRWITRCNNPKHSGQHLYSLRPRHWNNEVPCIYGGSMHTVLWYADRLGYSDIGLVGCDLGITKPHGNFDNNHFRSDYISYIDGDWNKQNATLVDMHKIINENYKSKNKRIVNCGIGGNLNVYPRVQLRNWL